jgi:hypothetical protein
VDVHRLCAGARAQHEQRSDHQHVDEHDVLEPGRVRGLEHKEGGHERDRPGAEVCDEAERQAREDDCEPDCERGGQLAARDRT